MHISVGSFLLSTIFLNYIALNRKKLHFTKTWVYPRGIWLYFIYFNFFHKIRCENSFFCVYMVSLTQKYTLDACHSLKISHWLDFKNAEFDDFRNFTTTFCKNFLIPSETETRNMYSRVCRNKTGNCCLSVFSFVGQCYSSPHIIHPWRIQAPNYSPPDCSLNYSPG